MDSREIIRAIAPSGVVVFVAIKTTNSRNKILTEHRPNIDSAWERMQELNHQGFNVYLQTAQYGDARTANGNIVRKGNVSHSSVADVDLDVGPNKPYKSVGEAGKALKAALDSTGIDKPTVIIKSGHGLRALWRFSTPMVREAWLQLTRALLKALRAAGLQMDEGVTTNWQSGVRIPGQLNLKDPNAPRPVELVVCDSSRVYNVEEFKKNLQGDLPYVDDSDLSGGTTPSKLRFTIARIGDQCPMLTNERVTGGAGASEVHWKRIMRLLSVAEDGEEYIHTFSKGHAGYTPAATEEKYQEQFDEDGTPSAGPTLCSTFNAPQCKTCPHNGYVGTPGHLGKAVVRKLPEGFFIKPGVGTFRKVWDKKSGEEVPFNFTKYVFTEAALTRTTADGEGEHRINLLALDVKARTPGNEVVNMVFPAEVIANKVTLARILNGAGIAVSSNIGDFMELMKSWIEHLQETGDKSVVVENVGWVSRPGQPTGFALPEHVYFAGEEHPEVTPKIDPGVGSIYTTSGTLDKWKAAAQAVANGGNAALSVALAVGFGAPLMQFTNVSGGVVSLNSVESGTGKTTSINAGASIWGDPKKVMMLSDDTSNSIMGRLGKSPNLPVFWDEAFTQYSPDVARDVVNTVFRFSQGREKSRLRQTGTLKPGANWKTIVCLTSNYSIMDVVRMVKDQSNANLARIIEVPFGDIKRKDPAVDLLNNNYGHAGVVYAQWLSAKADKLEVEVPKLQLQIMQTFFNNDPQARFWAGIIACLVLGVRIAKHLKLVNIQEKRLRTFLLKACRAQINTHMEGRDSAPEDLVMGFIAASRKHVASFKYVNGINSSGGFTRIMHNEEFSSVHAYYNATTKELRIDIMPFRKWLTSRSHNAMETVSKLERMEGCKKERGTFGKGTPYPGPRTTMLVIDATDTVFKQVGVQQLGKK